MTPAPLVSIVMATYHWTEALRVSIPSVLRQTCTDWELLVVGDGCTDDSGEVVRSFCDERIRWLNRKSNSGSQGAPNNLGIASARGELIAYLGHDDIWAPDHLQRLLEAYDGSDRYFASATLVWFDESVSVHQLTGLAREAAPLSRCLLNCAVTPSGILHSRKLWVQAGPWMDWRDIYLPPDVEFFQRLARLAGEARRNGCATVAKVASGLRRDSYKRRDVTPQTQVAAKLAQNPYYLRDAALDFMLRQYPATAVVMLRAGLLLVRRMLADAGLRSVLAAIRRWRVGPGGHVRRLRRYRGLEK
jgi:glycosyltransferase involved in cell wall biosynthesis